MTPEAVGRDGFGRDLFLLELESWDAWPHDLRLPSDNFCLLVAADADNATAAEMERLAAAALDAGCVYACTWGPGCSQLHDVFDLASLPRETDGSVVMTTWHADESLRQAIDFLTSVAWPDDPWAATCRASIVCIVGNTQWLREARVHLQSRALRANRPGGYSL